MTVKDRRLVMNTAEKFMKPKTSLLVKSGPKMIHIHIDLITYLKIIAETQTKMSSHGVLPQTQIKYMISAIYLSAVSILGIIPNIPRFTSCSKYTEHYSKHTTN